MRKPSDAYRRTLAGASFAFALVFVWAPARAVDPVRVALQVDARELTRGILHVQENIPGVTGSVKLVYPQWIPGEHGPSGPVVNLATIVVRSNGERLTWRRDLVDMYAILVDVPPGRKGLDVSFDYLSADVERYSSARLSTPNLFVLTWNKVLLTPFADDYRDVIVTPSVTLPSAEWKYATALEPDAAPGAAAGSTAVTYAFKPVTMEMLVDSPLDAGLNMKRFPLGAISGAPVELAAFADTQEQLEIGEKRLDKLKHLVKEMAALYAARHFNHYTFLLTVSDVMNGEGLEHHQSSDDGDAGDMLIDDDAFANDLLAHEFNHSWNGKYRRPAGLATPNLNVPMHDDLLWVYEGMTQFYGELQSARSGIWSKQQWLDALASTYAFLDTTTGRQDRSLLDTAVSAQVLYGAPRRWEKARRGVDFYNEGNLMWLLADVTIRTRSGGKRSIDDFARAFFGRTNTGPEVVTYTRQDVIEALNAVQPYDWAGFFATWIDGIAPHPPDPFVPAGWRIVYRPAPNAFDKLRSGSRKVVDAWYSLGFGSSTDGTIVDVRQGSVAALAGIGPGMKIVGLDGRTFDGDQTLLDNALKRAQSSGGIKLLVTDGGTYREVTLEYHDGPRYPHLERVPKSADVLSRVAAPRRSGP